MSDEELLVHKWKREVFDQHNEIDPNAEHDWRSLAMGYALGHGHSIKLSEEFVYSLTCRGWI